MITKIAGLMFAAASVALLAPMGQAADSLQFYKNYFVTGDYVVGGVGLRGTGVNGMATGTITISGLPCLDGHGGITTVCAAGSTPAANVTAAYLYWQTDESTASPVGALGYFDGQPIKGTLIGDPNNAACFSSGGSSNQFGRVYRADVLRHLPVSNTFHTANGPHTVQLVDSGGNGNGNLLYTEGATLVIVYQTLVPGQPAIAPLKSVVFYDGSYTMTKQTAGFSLNVGGFYDAVGGANSMSMTPIVSGGQSSFTENLTVNGTNLSTQPFTGTAGARWDNPLFQFNPGAHAKTYNAQVSGTNNQVCLVFASVVTSTPVVNTDGDGILNVWKLNGMHLNTASNPATFGGCSDYPGDPCVDLPHMGASVGKHDVFLQLDWMDGTGDGTGGQDGHGYHNHLPTQGALNMVCQAFAQHNINLHFDVGANYPGQPCIIPQGYVKSRSAIAESDYVCHDTMTLTCSYHLPFPVLSFKRGFLSVKDGNPHLILPSTNQPAAAHFDHIRKDIFHYVLFAHALAGPFDNTGKPTSALPGKTSGIADRPGGDLMITLGMWRSDNPLYDQVQSDLVQAGTLMHELGHNFDLSHNGLQRTPNCVPTYQSVMNYLYQTHGLTDLGPNSPQGPAEHIDYSSGTNGMMMEATPPSILSGFPYRLRYYAPYNAATNTPDQIAKLHCDGSVTAGDGDAGNSYVRLETAAGNPTPDWANGTTNTGYPDLNYDGVPSQTYSDQPDWMSLNFSQVSARPNLGGISTDVGFADAGFADAGFADAGFADAGFADAGFADAGFADAGTSDFNDVNYDTHLLSSVDPALGLVAVNELSDIKSTWAPPATGNVDHYNIYRCAVIAPAASCTPVAPAFKTAPGMTPTPSFTDTVNDFTHSGQNGDSTCGTGTCYNTTYVYYVTAVVIASGMNSESLPSNLSAPTEISHLFVYANNQTINYGDPLPAPPQYATAGDFPANLSGVACNYFPSGTAVYTVAGIITPKIPGTYAILCTGPAQASPADGVDYNVVYLNPKPGVLTIKARPVTPSITASDKVYDTTTAAVIQCTLSSISSGDDVSCGGTGMFPNPNVGSYPVTGNVSLRGQSAIYYVLTTTAPVTTVNARITPATATISVSPYTVTYNAMPHTATGTATGVNNADLSSLLDLSGTTHTDGGTYSSDRWSFRDPMGNYFPAGATITDKINPAPQTITFLPLPDRIYGNPPFAVGATATSGLAVTFTATGNCTISGSTATLTGGGNCTITANQGGNMNYLPALPVMQSFHIAAFTATGSLSTPRSFHTATLLTTGPNAGKVLIAGGLDAGGAPLATAELYDPVARTFSLTGSNMPSKAAGHTATLLPGGKVLLLGGGNSSSEIYDPATNTFSSAGGIGGQRTYHTATLLGNGKVLIAGGSDNSGKTVNSALLYDPVTGSYSSTGNMTVARDFHTATLLASGPNAGKVLIAGGRTGSSPYTYLASAELYDPVSGSFTAVPGSMTAARYGHTATLVTSGPNAGKLLIAGGAAAGSLASAELYDPNAAAAPYFVATGSLTTPRQFFPAFVFANAVVAAGGRNGSSSLASAEMDPNTAFLPAGTMTAARAAHTATVLGSGSVLIVGGVGSGGNSIATAEILQ